MRSGQGHYEQSRVLDDDDDDWRTSKYALLVHIYNMARQPFSLALPGLGLSSPKCSVT